MQDIFLPVAALPQWELSMKVPQLLGLQGPWKCQVCGDMDCLHKSSGPIRVFFQASCSWWAEGLFGQSLSAAPPVQGPGSFSVVQCASCLMVQPLHCSAAALLAYGEREAMVMALPLTWLSSIALLPWLPRFPSLAFPTMISSLTSPQSVSLQSTLALTLGLLHSP